MKKTTKNNIVEISRKVIRSETEIELLSIHEFKNDSEAHDDKYQRKIHKEFQKAFNNHLKELEIEYGKSLIAEMEDEFDIIPLCGVFHSAIWKLDHGNLYLAVSHEDRETPVLLILGYKHTTAQQGDAPEPDSHRPCLLKETFRPGDL
jgi:hypothetical protein